MRTHKTGCCNIESPRFVVFLNHTTLHCAPPSANVQVDTIFCGPYTRIPLPLKVSDLQLAALQIDLGLVVATTMLVNRDYLQRGRPSWGKTDSTVEQDFTASTKCAPISRRRARCPAIRTVMARSLRQQNFRPVPKTTGKLFRPQI